MKSLIAEARIAEQLYLMDIEQPYGLHYNSDSQSEYFFFFQAEDGIRDLTVTGVQTCALPIFTRLKIVAFTAMPRANVSTATAVNPGFLTSIRMASRKSMTKVSIGTPHLSRFRDRKSVV